MTLTTDRMKEIMVATVVGNPIKLEGEEEKAFLLAFHEEFAEAKEKGQTIEIPSEWEVETK